MECVEALDNRPIRQGDIFSWLPAHQTPPWRLHAVVVTADCDLARGKSHGTLSYLPLLRLVDYLWYFWLPSKFAPVKETAINKLAERFTKIISRSYGSEAQQMAAQSVLDWLDRADNATIAQELRLVDKGIIDRVCTECDKVRMLKRLLDSKDPDLEFLKKCYPIKNPTAIDPAEKLREEIRSHVSALPGDVFWLSELLPSTDGSYVAMLRYISQCDIIQIAVDNKQIHIGNTTAKRTARLTLPYLHAMTQSLGKVFADIGLPDAYSTRRTLCADNLGIV